MPFNNFPFINLNNFNLDWIISFANSVNDTLADIYQKAANAANSATNAANSATNATNSATNAANSANDAQQSATAISNQIARPWNNATTYKVNDVIIHNNILWRCLVQNTGVTPVEGTYWTAINISDEIARISTPINVELVLQTSSVEIYHNASWVVNNHVHIEFSISFVKAATNAGSLDLASISTALIPKTNPVGFAFSTKSGTQFLKGGGITINNSGIIHQTLSNNFAIGDTIDVIADYTI